MNITVKMVDGVFYFSRKPESRLSDALMDAIAYIKEIGASASACLFKFSSEQVLIDLAVADTVETANDKFSEALKEFVATAEAQWSAEVLKGDISGIDAEQAIAFTKYMTNRLNNLPMVSYKLDN
jgi:hypothetical protein